MKRLFSGIQPTGTVHIGNYFGALREWLTLSDKHESFFCVVDYHAITIPYDPKDMRANRLEAALTFLAIGLDPKRSTLFFQADVPEHTELAWIFNSLTNMGALERMTQYKDKAEQFKENINSGLFCYPVLQAADILIYKAQLVPVGKDQEQHLELTREIARKFNSRFGQTFPEPQTALGETPKILGLDGKSKMSKSKGNTIDILDPPDVIQQKLKSAFTDPQRLRRKDPGHPEICNIWALHKLVQTQERVDTIAIDCRAATLGCADCKMDLGQRLGELFREVRERHAYWKERPKEVLDIFHEGGKHARQLAAATMVEVREKMGLDRPRF